MVYLSVYITVTVICIAVLAMFLVRDRKKYPNMVDENYYKDMKAVLVACFVPFVNIVVLFFIVYYVVKHMILQK